MTASLKKILLVEDEEDIREVAKLALETVGGFSVETCESGEAALEKAPGFGPELIILDVMMPGMDGPTTLGALRELSGLEHTPVIFMTAKVMEAEVQRYKDLGAVDVIAKPFDPMTLSEQVRDAWSKA